MAGHSKWANIKHRKERMDNKRGKEFSRLVKEIYVAARLGGDDPATNPRLRLALQKAKEGNLPKDNMDKAIARGAGKLEGVAYEEIRYEGYGPAGIALIVDCLSDNRNRTTSEVRHAFSKHGGTLGTDGSVAFMFERVGQLLFAPGCDVDKLVELAIEAGARDFVADADGSLEIVSDTDSFEAVIEALEGAKASPASAAIVMRANNIIEVSDEVGAKVQRLIEALENCDDTQQIYSNAQQLG